MTMRLLHAVIVVLTALLFLVRKRYIFTAVPIPTIKHEPVCPACGDASFPNMPLWPPSDDCYLCTRAACVYQQALTQPKYKRDPEITVDNEGMGEPNG